ncbi:MAG: hypothetical protein BMS9Abin13_186 [Patescibacteria group bacterium]|nr:MAG: hypothetical protein BMS9Abin13_186 [Patescibacteria group bacterium]
MNTKTCGWVCVIAGIWLIMAPFVLGYSVNVAALWNDVLVGLVILSVGAYMCFPKKAS